MLQTIAIYSRHDLGHPDDIVLSSFVGTESEKFNGLCAVVEDDSSCVLACFKCLFNRHNLLN